MHSGLLDREIILKTPARNVDPTFGSVKKGEFHSVTLPAHVRPEGSREVLAARQSMPELDVIFVIRYRTGVKPTDVVLYDSEEFDIFPPRELGRRKWLEIPAKRRH